MSSSYLEKYRPRRLDEVVGNEQAKRRLTNWLIRMGVPRNVLFFGPTGSGKTTLARICAAALSCDNRSPSSPDPCQRDTCPCALVLQADVAFGRGARARNGVDMSRADLDDDFAELAYVHEKPMIFIYDEIHRAPAHVRDSLLTRVESSTGLFHVFVVATDTTKLEPAFVTRFSRIETVVPTADQVVALLRRVSEAEDFGVSDEELSAIAWNDHLPRASLTSLWDLASTR
jgi:DNA polymerase-3 subunit gamma/tau